MKHYDDTIARMRSGTKLPMISALLNEGADAIEELRTDLKDCRNELCLRCGQYKQKHLGACEGCRWTT
mgnify:FL=1